ncbi:hypothetical protein DS893_16720 [Vibrionales bacterium C3R12]|nr:hypothetical protein DS893_16720 [Vibrionales bacterium C3R12]
MKKLTLACMLVLAGCSTAQVDWQQDSQMLVAQSEVKLSSNLWVNKMPQIGEAQEQTLNGSIYLKSDTSLPATLELNSVTLRQGEDLWLLDGDAIEVRTHSENSWEIAFQWQLDVLPNLPIDIAVETKNEDKVEWLVEKGVNIDAIY